MINVTINDRPVEAEPGSTILQAARAAGIHVPTPVLPGRQRCPSAPAACAWSKSRAPRPSSAACATPVTDGMKVRTNTGRVRSARRTVVELLLSEHEGDCQTCDRNEDCELQALAHELGIRDLRYNGEKPPVHIDCSTPALVRDIGQVHQVPPLRHRLQRGAGRRRPLSRSTAASAPRSAPAFAARPGRRRLRAVRPVRRRLPRRRHRRVEPHRRRLAAPSRTRKSTSWSRPRRPSARPWASASAAARHAGDRQDGLGPAPARLRHGLRHQLHGRPDDHGGRHRAAGAPEEGAGREAGRRAAACSPAARPAGSSSPSTSTRSSCRTSRPASRPQQMFGALAKTYYAEQIGKKAEDMVVVSVMPCTAKKFEAQRPEMNASGVQDVDYVLTTRELARMIKQAGIDFLSLPDDKMDAPLGLSIGRGRHLRQHRRRHGSGPAHGLRDRHRPRAARRQPARQAARRPPGGQGGGRHARQAPCRSGRFLEGVDAASIAVAHGLGNARKLHGAHQERGGALPLRRSDDLPRRLHRRRRPAPLYHRRSPRRRASPPSTARTKARRCASRTRTRTSSRLYESSSEPLGESSHHLLHTHYAARSRL